MTRLHETLETSLDTDRAFAFIADFANARDWDPGVAWSKAVADGQPKVGSTYELGVRMGRRGVTPMAYRITQLEPGTRVVLTGTGSNVAAVDDISFEKTERGTRIQYTADIQLTGKLRLVAPFAGRAFAAIGRNARDGMQRTLDDMAATGHEDTDREHTS